MTRSRRSTEDWAGWVEPIYVDSSALVKLFVKEASSGLLNAALSAAAEVILSDLTFTELASTLGRLTREGRLTAVQSRMLYHQAEKVRPIGRAELTPPVHRRAERLLLTSSRIPLRAADALHIATALDAGAATIVSFDGHLRESAKSQGLFVVPSHI